MCGPWRLSERAEGKKTVHRRDAETPRRRINMDLATYRDARNGWKFFERRGSRALEDERVSLAGHGDQSGETYDGVFRGEGVGVGDRGVRGGWANVTVGLFYGAGCGAGAGSDGAGGGGVGGGNGRVGCGDVCT